MFNDGDGYGCTLEGEGLITFIYVIFMSTERQKGICYTPESRKMMLSGNSWIDHLCALFLHYRTPLHNEHISDDLKGELTLI